MHFLQRKEKNKTKNKIIWHLGFVLLDGSGQTTARFHPEYNGVCPEAAITRAAGAGRIAKKFFQSCPEDRRKPRILRQPPLPPSFPRRRESTTVANLETLCQPPQWKGADSSFAPRVDFPANCYAKRRSAKTKSPDAAEGRIRAKSTSASGLIPKGGRLLAFH